ncbi:glutathione S-transferase [Hyaloscypha sp. PMI_1271]|nr:glutathione S-transferase [Hyaloscypha sp. PMI_1271]
MTALYTDETPTAVKEAKVQILLEELKDVYGISWTTSLLNPDAPNPEQNKDWFLRLNPNARIPILIDNTQTPPFVVMESLAELLYLQETVDKDNVFGFDNKVEQSEAVQWLFFWAAGQPMQSQNNYFSRSAPEKLPSEQNPVAISRFRAKTLEMYGVLELRLSGRYTTGPRGFLAGDGKGKYSIADIGAWPWLRAWKRTQISDEEMASFPHLLGWIARVAARPAVGRGTSNFYDSDENPELLVSTEK